MSHEIEVVNGKASFVYNAKGGRPWHLLGKPVDGQQPATIMLGEAFADYEVIGLPIYVKDDRTGEFQIVKERRATGRINPHTDELQTFEVVKNRYQIVQNSVVLDKALAIVGASGGDAVIETLGVLKDGARFFAVIDLGSLIIDPNGIADRIARYLTCHTSHDGTMPITYANTDVRIVCANTERMAIQNAESVFRAKHTPNVESAIVEAQNVLHLSTEWADAFKKEAEKLLAIDIPAGGAKENAVFGTMFPEVLADTDRKKANRAELIGKITSLYVGGNNGPRVGFNGWGLYNAFTEYYDHYSQDDLKARAEASMDERSLVSAKKVAAKDAIMAIV